MNDLTNIKEMFEKKLITRNEAQILMSNIISTDINKKFAKKSIKDEYFNIVMHIEDKKDEDKAQIDINTSYKMIELINKLDKHSDEKNESSIQLGHKKRNITINIADFYEIIKTMRRDEVKETIGTVLLDDNENKVIVDIRYL